jgi:hypothetical protein
MYGEGPLSARVALNPGGESVLGQPGHLLARVTHVFVGEVLPKYLFLAQGVVYAFQGGH